MPLSWSDTLYNYTSKTILQNEIDALDVEGGKWFQCKFCKNPKDPEGKFWGRTAFSEEAITGKQGHLNTKTHREKRETAEQDPSRASKGKGKLAHLLNAGPSTALASTASSAGADAPASDAATEKPKVPLPCQGLGWEITEDFEQWQSLCKTYLTYVAGADRASGKFHIEVENQTYRAKSVDCAEAGIKGFQHGVVCCKPCHKIRCDKDSIAKNSLQSMDDPERHAASTACQPCSMSFGPGAPWHGTVCP